MHAISTMIDQQLPRKWCSCCHLCFGIDLANLQDNASTFNDRSKPTKAPSKNISVHLLLGKSTFVDYYKYVDWKQDCTIVIKTIT
jgi:hypothetical protein